MRCRRFRCWMLCGLLALAAAGARPAWARGVIEHSFIEDPGPVPDESDYVPLARAFERPESAAAEAVNAESKFPYASAVWVEEHEVMDPRFDFKPTTTPANGDGQSAGPFRCGNSGRYESIEYPLWDGKETVSAYAERAGLPAAFSVDLGGGEFLDMILVPAGSGVIGTPAPRRPDEEWRGALVTLSSVCIILLLLQLSVLDALFLRTRLQFSLRRLTMLGLAASAALGGGMWWSDLQQAREIYEVRRDLRAVQARSTIEVSVPFYMSRCEVTRVQARIVLGPRSQAAGAASEPATNLTWAQVLEFCDGVTNPRQTWPLLSIPPRSLTDSFRLPTETEWEYACRAGTKSVYGLGDGAEALDRAGWWSSNSGAALHPVGQKAPNAFGLYDMHGNAAEWCAKDDSANRQGATAYLQGISGGTWEEDQVTCGGSYLNARAACASAYRQPRRSEGPGNIDVGFRILLGAPMTRGDDTGFRAWLAKNSVPEKPGQ